MGKAYRINDAEGRYIEFAKNSIPKGMDFEGMKIVLDCANGAAYKVAPMMLRGSWVWVFKRYQDSIARFFPFEKGLLMRSIRKG